MNIHPIQKALWGERKSGVPGVLNDYELKAYDNNIFYIVKKFGEQTVGKVYELDDEQLRRTDRYETSAYKRVKVKLDGFDGFVEVYVKA